MLKSISATELKQLLDAGDAVLVDIREPNEHAQENIVGAVLAPLSCFDPQTIEAARDKIVVFHCKSGMRTQNNARALAACGFVESYFLAGGIEAWKKAGYSVHR
jgi:rhodanese-related sulfurtransferase